MKCEKCGGDNIALLMIYCDDGTRHYQCMNCGYRFTNKPEPMPRLSLVEIYEYGDTVHLSFPADVSMSYNKKTGGDVKVELFPYDAKIKEILKELKK